MSTVYLYCAPVPVLKESMFFVCVGHSVCRYGVYTCVLMFLICMCISTVLTSKHYITIECDPL